MKLIYIVMLLSSLATAKPVTYTRTKYHVDFKAAVVVNDVASSIGRPGEIGLPVPTGSIWSCFIGNLNLSQDGVYRNIICNANGTKASVISTVMCPTDHLGADSAILGLLVPDQKEKVMITMQCVTSSQSVSDI